MNTVLIALGGCGVVILLLLLTLAIWDDVRAGAINHPFDDDIPPSWG